MEKKKSNKAIEPGYHRRLSSPLLHTSWLLPSYLFTYRQHRNHDQHIKVAAAVNINLQPSLDPNLDIVCENSDNLAALVNELSVPLRGRVELLARHTDMIGAFPGQLLSLAFARLGDDVAAREGDGDVALAAALLGLEEVFPDDGFAACGIAEANLAVPRELGHVARNQDGRGQVRPAVQREIRAVPGQRLVLDLVERLLLAVGDYLVGELEGGSHNLE